MAKTWTVKEAFDAIVANDSSAIADFGKRFPLATCALSRSGENDGLKVLMGAMPDRVTLRILESSLKGGVEESDDDDAEDEAPKKSAKREQKVEKPKKSVKAKKEAEPDDDDDDDDDEVEDDTPDYTKMSAVELYKECKKRGIKVEPKQKSKVYIDALNAADSDSNDDEDDFEEEEDEKPSKKSQKKSAPAKKPSKNDDEDEWDI